jgi:thiol-disulfide isomerase/thioredoxin
MNKKALFSYLLLLLLMFTACSSNEGSSITTAKPMGERDIQKLIEAEQCFVVVVAMAVWCSPCREELPILQKLYSKYKDRGLSIIGISLDMGGPEAMQPLIDAYGLDFPIYWGGEKITAEYGISAIPLIMIAKQGQIVERITGKQSEDFLDNKITAMLAECGK